jgi:hypothetical protein
MASSTDPSASERKYVGGRFDISGDPVLQVQGEAHNQIIDPYWNYSPHDRFYDTTNFRLLPIQIRKGYDHIGRISSARLHVSTTVPLQTFFSDTAQRSAVEITPPALSQFLYTFRGQEHFGWVDELDKLTCSLHPDACALNDYQPVADSGTVLLDKVGQDVYVRLGIDLTLLNQGDYTITATFSDSSQEKK